MEFTTQELTDIVLMYGECHYNVEATRRLYVHNFPQRQHPSRTKILQLVQRLRDTGSMLPTFEGRGRERPPHILEAEEAMLAAVDEDPTTSTRSLARDVGVSQPTVDRILRAHLLYPYHIQRVQHLTINDFPARRAFCQWFRQKSAVEPGFVGKVLFTDECCFTRDGILNFHNAHHWSDANPHIIRQSRFQWRFSVNVWCGILGDQLFGPIFLPARLNGDSYLDFLRNTLPDLMDDVPLLLRASMYFMHDGAPPHITRPVCNFLNASFPNRWFGRNGPLRWPPRSPDMNPLDYFLWGHMKTIVYRTDVENAEDLQQRILAAGEEIRNTPGVFERVRSNFHRRLEACMQAHGGHFQQFL